MTDAAHFERTSATPGLADLNTSMDDDSTSPRFSEVIRLTARLIASTPDLADVLSQTARAIQQQLDYDHVAVYLTEPSTSDLALCAVASTGSSHIASAQYHLPKGEGTPGQAVTRGQAVRLGEGPFLPALGLATTVSELSVPIWQGQRAMGALTVASSRPAAFSSEDEQLLNLLAEHLAAAMRSADFERREAERALHQQLLIQVSQAINSSLELSRVLQQAVVKIGEGLKADRCILSRLDLKANLLVTDREYINPILGERRSLKGARPFDHSPTGLAYMLVAGRVIISTEDNIHPVLQDMWDELARRYGIRSLAWVPILGQVPDRSYSLCLMQVTHARRWTKDDIALLRGIADQLALALRNAELFDAVQNSATELQAKNDELESFVYTVSHDLQAPVVSLRGFASLLQSRYRTQLDGRGQTYVDRIAANAEFLSRLLQDLLELSRIGRAEEPDERVPVGEVIEQALGDLAQPLAERAVRVDLPLEWPVVIYPRTHLRQIFSNLLSNAIKFLGPQPEPCIALGWRQTAGTEEAALRFAPAGPRPDPLAGPAEVIEFFVQDNGIGIHPDYHQRIFSPFQRLKTLDVDGTGVGLNIVKRIVESRHGTVWVDSAPNVGATFYFTIPVAPAPRAEVGTHGDRD
jgi:signal transduction histidine kinase/putative methionine-R-sulfoxide reductase with GAF domain